MLRPVIYSFSALLCGCASAPRALPPPSPTPQPPVLSVARVEVHSDVAIIPSDMEYVLYPQRQEPAPTVFPDRPAPAAAPASMAEAAAVAVKVSAPLADSAKHAAAPGSTPATAAPIATAATTRANTETSTATVTATVTEPMSQGNSPAAPALRIAKTSTPVETPKTPPAGAAPSSPTAPAAVASREPQASAAEVLAAWTKYCHADSEISPAEWALIDSTTVPAELAKDWAKKCVPQK